MLRPRALDHVGLKVTDMDKTLHFYQRLGLTLLRTSGPNADGLRSAVIAHHAVSPAQLYFIAVVRVAFGVLLISVAARSRAPNTLRVVALVPLVAGIATPFVGVERAPAIIEWWSQQGSAVIRLTAIAVLALGGFVAYACAPGARVALNCRDALG
jgi:catechol 2,3-dioxygenase-like lactoylglutathione lyase family enzyme